MPWWLIKHQRHSCMHLLQVIHNSYSTLTFTTFYMDESPDVLRIRTGIPPVACLPADDKMP